MLATEAKELRPALTVRFLSGHRGEETAVIARHRLLLKPFRNGELLDFVDQALRRRD